jgi:hypothetical protein
VVSGGEEIAAALFEWPRNDTERNTGSLRGAQPLLENSYALYLEGEGGVRVNQNKFPHFIL